MSKLDPNKDIRPWVTIGEAADDVLDKIIAKIHAAMERRDGPTVGYGVGKSSSKVVSNLEGRR